MRFWWLPVAAIVALPFAPLPQEQIPPEGQLPPAAIYPGQGPVFPPDETGGVSSSYADASACWTFDEPTDLGNDDCTNTHDLTLMNTPLPTGGATGYAMSVVEASNQLSYVADDASLDVDDDSLTISIWMRPSAITGTSYFVGKAPACTTTGSNYYARLDAGGTVSFGITSAAIRTSVGTLTVGTRHHVQVEWDQGSPNGTPAITIDGNREVLGAYGISIASNNDDFTIGNLNKGCPGSIAFSGEIDAAAFWNGTALGGTSDTYNGGLGGDCAYLDAATSGLTACWDKEEDGGPYLDAIGSLDLTAQNTPTRKVGLVNLPDSGMSGHLVNASDSYFRIADDDAWNPVGVSFTWQVWTASLDNSYKYLIGKFSGGGTPNSTFYLYKDASGGGRIVGGAGDNTTEISQGASVADFTAWHHVLYWYDGSTKQVTIRIDNAAAVSSAPWAFGPPFNNTAVIGLGDVGTYDWNVGLTGEMDMVAFWPSVPDEDRQDALWAAGAGVYYTMYLEWMLEQPRFAWSQPPTKQIVKRKVYVR